jgi:excisionase family DNA binding protein
MIPNPWDRPLLTVDEAAQVLGVHRSTVYRMMDRRELGRAGPGRVATTEVLAHLGLPVPPPPTDPLAPRIVTAR